MKRACMSQPRTLIRMREFFSRLSIVSVDDKQHLSEVVFRCSRRIFIERRMKEKFGLRVIPVDPGLVTSGYGVHDVGVTVCGVQSYG